MSLLIKDTTKEEMRKLQDGDQFVINGNIHVAVTGAHKYTGKGRHNGFVVYDEEGDTLFEEMFPD